MKLLLTTAITAVITASTAFAGSVTPAPVDNIVVAVPAPQATDWSGFYAGGLASFDSGSTEYFIGGAPVPPIFDIDGSMYGVFAGYNAQRGAIVFGGEIAYSVGSTYLSGFPTFEFENFLDVKGRVGYAIGNALVYAVVGGSLGSWTNSAIGTFERTGMNYGAGVDYLVTDRVFIGAEYLIRSLSGDFALVSPNEGTEHSVESLQIRAGIKF